ncbi:GTPase [Noviherbaspirillum autotrophicum]|uniref:GTPase n=1 Tax=Noviherbaspirillum autotrophicum TaxID=709839 RepID=UPI000A077D1E|nr:GTPase [Noviherbaspirillum autotrophicum]
MTLTTLVLGATALQREAAIASAFDPTLTTALILEGIASDHSPLDTMNGPRISRIAPGCLCCSGNMTMRVTLNRILRHPPQRLYISLANSAHLDGIRRFLSDTPYDELLQLTQAIHA